MCQEVWDWHIGMANSNLSGGVSNPLYLWYDRTVPYLGLSFWPRNTASLQTLNQRHLTWMKLTYEYPLKSWARTSNYFVPKTLRKVKVPKYGWKYKKNSKWLASSSPCFQLPEMYFCHVINHGICWNKNIVVNSI